jgi:hypothetical protein
MTWRMASVNRPVSKISAARPDWASHEAVQKAAKSRPNTWSRDSRPSRNGIWSR